MPGRIYAVPASFTITAANTDSDLWSIQPADDKPCRLVGFILGQTSEVGDAAEENLRITVQRLPATFTVGSGGTAITAKTPQGSSADPVWGFSARHHDTTLATTSGTAEILDNFGWNIRNTPFEHWYPDEDTRPGATQAQGLVIRNHTTVVDDVSFEGVAFIQELM